jgi:hypothetical protein
VPDRGVEVVLSFAANASSGGRLEEVTDQTHPSILELATKIRYSLPGLGHCGVDILMEDHRKPLCDQPICAVEVNSHASIWVHHFPAIGRPVDAADEIFKWTAKSVGLPLGSVRDGLVTRQRLELSKPSDVTDFEKWIEFICACFSVSLRAGPKSSKGLTFQVEGAVSAVAAIAAKSIRPRPGLVAEYVASFPEEQRK